jgi:hypothetical protein
MKPKSILTALAVALLAPGALFAQTTATTTPVGYVTEILKPEITNIVGLTLHSPTVFSGTITGEAADKLTVASANFTSLLTEGSTYILELPNGTIQEITSWSATELNTPQDVTSDVTPNTTSFKLRKAPTIGEVFGANNSVGFTPSPDGSTTACDTIAVPNGTGGFTTYFYYNDGTDQLWVDVDFNEAVNVPLIYTDALLIKRVAGSDLNLTIAGEIKTTPTNVVVISGTSYLGSIYPAGNTLASSSFSSQIIPSADGSTLEADLIQFPNGTGGFVTNMYYNDGTDQLWVDVDFNETATSSFGSAYVFANKGQTKLLTHTPDSAVYSGL